MPTRRSLALADQYQRDAKALKKKAKGPVSIFLNSQGVILVDATAKDATRLKKVKTELERQVFIFPEEQIEPFISSASALRAQVELDGVIGTYLANGGRLGDVVARVSLDPNDAEQATIHLPDFLKWRKAVAATTLQTEVVFDLPVSGSNKFS